MAEDCTRRIWNFECRNILVIWYWYRKWMENRMLSLFTTPPGLSSKSIMKTGQRATPNPRRNRSYWQLRNFFNEDVRAMQTSKDNYPASADWSSLEDNIDFVPESLQQLLRTLFPKDSDLRVASIGHVLVQFNSITHHFASRLLIDTLAKLGFCSSYREVQNFALHLKKEKTFLLLVPTFRDSYST